MKLLPLKYLLKTYSVKLMLSYMGLLMLWMALPDSLQDWLFKLAGRTPIELGSLLMMLALLVSRAVRQPKLEGLTPDTPPITGHGVL